MAKVATISDDTGVKYIRLHCPGCGDEHLLSVKIHQWDGSMDAPTISPSLLHDGPKGRCHSFIKNGNIQFLNDSNHKLAGQTVPLPDWPNEVE